MVGPSAGGHGKAGGGGGGWREIPFKEGEAFEVNNLIRHRVTQAGPYDRVTLILDINEKPCTDRLDLAGPELCPALKQSWWKAPGCVIQRHAPPSILRPDPEEEEEEEDGP